VNLEDDADTTGAIYGQLAGAFYGLKQISAEWRAKLAMFDFIVERQISFSRLRNFKAIRMWSACASLAADANGEPMDRSISERLKNLLLVYVKA
jgi:hypothetical protein